MRILSLGAGVQSTTLYLTEDWDYAIFADTQEEPESVYAHLEWLRYTVVRSPILVRTAGKLGDDLMRGTKTTGGRSASVPFYTIGPHDVREGRTRRQCTSDYKLTVIHQTIREILGLKKYQRFPKDVKIVQGIGFSYDEQGRIGRCLSNWKRPEIMPIFPLYEKRWTRWNCVEYLKQRVPHPVPRSSCVFCPFHTQEEWRWLRDNEPNGWARAVEVDRELRVDGNVVNRNMDKQLFAHRSCVPLDQADLGDNELDTQLTFEGCTGGCAA